MPAPTHILVADTGNNRIKKHDISTLAYVSKIGSLGAGIDQFNAPDNLCSDGEFIWVSDGANNRIVKRKFSDLSYVSQIGSLGVGDNQFNQPKGIISYKDHLYVCDYNNRRMFKRLKSDLSYVMKYGSVGAGIDQLNGNSGVGISEDHMFIAEGNNNRLMRRDRNTFLYSAHVAFGGGPWGCCTDGKFGYISTINVGNHGIHKFRLDTLVVIASLSGGIGGGDNQFSSPMGLATDGKNLYVADNGNGRIKVHRCSDLAFVNKFGTTGAGDNQFNALRGIALNFELTSGKSHHRIGSKSALRFR